MTNTNTQTIQYKIHYFKKFTTSKRNHLKPFEFRSQIAWAEGSLPPQPFSPPQDGKGFSNSQSAFHLETLPPGRATQSSCQPGPPPAAFWVAGALCLHTAGTQELSLSPGSPAYAWTAQPATSTLVPASSSLKPYGRQQLPPP